MMLIINICSEQVVDRETFIYGEIWKSALTGFGERPVRAYYLCEPGKLTNGAA